MTCSHLCLLDPLGCWGVRSRKSHSEAVAELREGDGCPNPGWREAVRVQLFFGGRGADEQGW